MDSTQVIKKLGYKGSPAFLQDERLEEHHGYSFFFTQAKKQDHCNLKGVYALLDSSDNLSGSSLTPVVYVCEAENENQAVEIHRRVWNQNIVPFLIVVTPKNIRLYSGFEYDREKSDEDRTLAIAKNANEVLKKLSALKSESIDSGDIWKQIPLSVEGRVDRRLLANLKELSDVLTGTDYELPIEHAHTLIGKYIYLKYLRDKDILSDTRLLDAGVNEKHVFSSAAQKDKLYKLEKYLNGFLNGSVFPLPDNNIETKHVQKVAGVFKGDDPRSGQGVLFDIYDFSYVPIETLSVVYQQFLHAKGQGRDKGAYYTPVHLVNFILDELDAKKPLKKGMKIFDPSAGSGAFLVQCYRRLVESESVVRGKRTKLEPTELRKLLVDHIFGLDADEEACRVAELSLSLTLLDYIEPHDLTTCPAFELPKLHNKNIFHCEGGFFDEESSWVESIPEDGYDWIVGNPPWKKLNTGNTKKDFHKITLAWIKEHTTDCPVGKQETAEAFAWKASRLLAKKGQCGLLMPALSLFNKDGHKFRSSFFSSIETWCIVNFANLRHSLFEGAKNPVAAFFYSGKKNWNKSEHYITTYAPFAVEQTSQLDQESKSEKLWKVFVNYSNIKEIPMRNVTDGSSEPWQLAMWGTTRDGLLLDRTRKKFPVLTEHDSLDRLTQGLELRLEPPPKDKEKDVELVNEIQGKPRLIMDELKDVGNIHNFPPHAFKTIPKDCDIYVRKGRKDIPLSICNPPHIIIDECRRFAVYSDEFIVVPPSQIGLSGKRGQEEFLKALALYLKSNAAYYFQFWSAVKMGTERSIFNLDDLKELPTPLACLSDAERTEWAKLHDEIVAADKRERDSQHQPLFNSCRRTSLPSLDTLLKQMNDKVYKLLGISKKQQWLIEDMLNVRMKLNDGKIAKEATDPATEEQITDFAHIFQEELDLFLDHTGKRKVHKVKVLYADSSAVIIVDHLMRSMARKPVVEKVQDGKIRQELEALQNRLTEARSQWMYFTRCLQIHEDRRTYIFKPRQRLYWLKSQALAEADDFIAEKLATDK